MAVSDTQKVDLLYKQAFRVAKTDTAANKDPNNESIVSPLLVRGDKIWNDAASIPGSAAAVAGIVQAYNVNATAIQCTADNTTTPIGGIYPTWKTNLTNWIPPEFGSSYAVAVYVDTTGSVTPTTTGTQIFAAGSGGTGEYYFDYNAGVLNFIGGTIPASLIAGKSIFILGYRYIGNVGLASAVSLGNTTITGFVNVSSTANVGGVATFRANVVANGQLIVANTASLGNTTVTGFINVSSSANVGGALNVNGAVTVTNTAALGNTTVTGFINVSSSANVGGALNVNGAVTVTNTASLGNTTVTGFINVSSTANVGGAVTARGDVTVNGALTVANTAALGNTTVTGFINVSSTANVGGAVTARGDVTVNGALTVANTAAVGNTTVTGFINVTSTAAVGNTTTSGFGNTTTLQRIGTARTTATLGGTANVNTSTDTITTSAAHNFVVNDAVLYLVAAGNTAIGGLTNNTIYYVNAVSNTTSFKLANTFGGSAVDLTTNPGLETGHSFVTSESVITPFTIFTGNSTVNAVVNSSVISVGNSTVNTVILPNSITTGNGVFGGNVSISGNLTVLGTTVTVTAANFTTSDNLIYLNEARTATVTGASSNGTAFLYVANNTFTALQVVTVTGVNPAGYNVTANTITFANATHFAVANTTAPGTYVSGGSASAKAAINPDLGFAGAYYDGTYRHAGFFRDATDGRFKVFDQYTPEPDAAVDINTADASFRIADLQARGLTVTTIGSGNTDITGYINVSSTANVGGVANFRANVIANGILTVANSISVGNTEITGYVNVSTTANVGGVANFRANVVANGQLIVANAASVGNTEVTGYINVSSTANVGGVANFRANVVANGQLIVANTASVGNTTVTGFINVSSTANIGDVLTARANVVANGQLIVSNTASLGNTTVTGFINVSSSANVGGALNVNGAVTVTNTIAVGNTTVTGFINVSSTANIGDVLTARANVVANGQLIVANAASVGNTTVTGFINVSSTANIGDVLTARANVVANGQLIVANAASVGNTTVTGFINVSSTANVGGTLNARSDLVVNGTLTVANSATVGNVTTGTITGGNTTITGFANILGTSATFNANTGVNGTTEFITTTVAHGFSNGDYVRYIVSTGNTALTGLTNANYYYITNANTTAFTLSAAFGGANVDVTPTTVSETGHTLIPQRIILGQDGSISTSVGQANVRTLRVLNTITANSSTGSAGQVLISGGSANAYWGTSLSAGGVDTQVQFNDGGSALGGDAGLTYNKTTDALTVAGSVLVGANVAANTSAVLVGNSTVNTTVTSTQLKLGGNISANGGVGSAGQVLISGGAANAYWGTSISAGGVDTQVQFNDGGSALGGDAGLTYNKTTDVLTVAGAVNVGANVAANTSALLVGNSTVNAIHSATGFVAANGTVTTTANTTQVSVGANVIANTSALLVGNSTVNAVLNSSSLVISSTSTNLITVGNSTVNSTLSDTTITANLASLGNTTVTGFINVSSTANVGGVANFRANVVANGQLIVSNTVTVGNTSVNAQISETLLSIQAINTGTLTTTGLINVGSTANIGGVANFRANVVANGQLIVANTISVGNTEISGYINVSSTANVGGVANFRANVVANGQLIVSNTASLGNTTVTGFANVTTTLQVGANVVLGTTTITANGGVGSAGQVLTSGASGNVYWSTVTAGGGGTPGGVDTQVQFNDATAFGGDAGLTYNKTTDTLTVAGAVNVGANVITNTSTVAVGNSTVNVIHTATGITARDGTVTTIANTTQISVGSNVVANTSALLVGAGTTNAVITQAGIVARDVSVTTIANTTQISIGSNVIANTSALLVGNSTVNTIINSTALAVTSSGSSLLTLGNSTVNSTLSDTSLTVGANVVANTTTIFVGNTTVNAIHTSTGFTARDGTVTTIANTVQVSVGANVIANTSSLLVGNSTVNATYTSAGLTVRDGTVTTLANTTQVSVGANVIANTSALLIGNSTVNTIITSTTLTTRDATISGNLTVSGTTTYINTTNLNIGDNIIVLNADVTGATTPTENAGIEVNRGNSPNVSFYWDESNDRWTAGNTFFANTTISGFANVTSTLQVSANVTLGTTTITANGGVGTSGQVLTSGGSGNVYWSTAAGGGASVTVSDTPPVSPSAGNLWWDSGNGILRIYYNDGTSSQWVDAVPAVGGGGGGTASITVSDTPPAGPTSGSLWWDSTVGVLRLYYNDGTSSQWVDALPQGGSGGSSVTTYILDDVSPLFDNVTKTFTMAANTVALIPDSPHRLRVIVGGVPIPPSVSVIDYYNAPENVTYTPGYTISGSTISFISAPLSGMAFYATMQVGDSVTPAFSATRSAATFNALNIMSGY